jgi:hypothetical protein
MVACSEHGHPGGSAGSGGRDPGQGQAGEPQGASAGAPEGGSAAGANVGAGGLEAGAGAGASAGAGGSDAGSGPVGSTGGRAMGGGGEAGDGGSAGQSGNAGESSSGGSAGTFKTFCGNGVVDGAEECERLVGCDAGERCSAQCRCEAEPSSPLTSQALIERARQTGEIDYATSLALRVLALFQAPELPEEYEGAGSEGEDTYLFLELSEVRPNPPPELRPTWPEELELAVGQYLVRPNDPASIYARACPLNESGLSDWRAHETSHFVVWSCGGGTLGNDPHAAARAIAGSAAEQAWTTLVPVFGAPIPDDELAGPGDPSRTDIYLVDLNQCRERSGSCAPIPGAPMVATTPSTPCGSNDGPMLSSAYISLAATGVPSAATGRDFAKFRYALAHQLFHAISFGISLEAQDGMCPSPWVDTFNKPRSWLTEASAEWAAFAFFGDDDPGRREKLFEDYQLQRRLDRDGLQATRGLLPNQAFLYLLFLQEESGGARDNVVEFIKSTSQVRNYYELDNHLEATLVARDHFRDFSLRNFNRVLPGSPIPARPTTGAGLPVGAPASLVLEPPLTWQAPLALKLPLKIAPLGEQTEHHFLGDEVRSWRIDLSEVQNVERVALDVVAKVGERYEHRRIEGPSYEFCRDDRPSDDISELFLIFSNFDRTRFDSAFGREKSGEVTGRYRVTASSSCPGGWSGNLHYYNAQQAPNQAGRVEHYWTIVGSEFYLPPGYPKGSEIERLRAIWRGYYPGDLEPDAAASGKTTFDALPVGSGMYSITPTGLANPEEPLVDILNIPELHRLLEDPADAGHFAGSTRIHLEGHDPEEDRTLAWDLRHRKARR